MKSNKYQKRFYRQWVLSKGLYQAQVQVRETDLQIITDKPVDKQFLVERIHLYRRQIEGYIARDRKFLTSLKPIAVELTAALIVKEMAEASRKAGVGPMAAVAGAIAQFLGRDLVKRGFEYIVIENGGDIYLKINRAIKIGLYAGESKLSGKLSLKIKPKDTPLGVCTSSGTVGHSLSFGSADSVVILAKNASLADAVATAAGNKVNSKNDLPKVVDFVRSIRGITGCLIVIKDDFVVWGNVELAG
ncbi:UPF0280 family protein [bacterium]|nr:MAG: UPF0280 family protein [bacterium]